MRRFLRSIGYTNVDTQAQIEDLVYNVIKEAGKLDCCRKNDESTIVEYTLEVTSNCGIIVRGEEDKDGRFHYGYFFPYCKGEDVNAEDEMYISKRIDTDTYTGMCDDSRLGISLIYYVRNLIDYINIFKRRKTICNAGMKLSALAVQGKIILPVEVRVEDTQHLKTEAKKKNQLLAEAKKGNAEAIESLTLNDIDKYASINHRINKEDLFSIVNTSIVPYGSESDMYSVVGNIIDVHDEYNRDTGAKIRIMKLECNGFYINTAISDEDLLGEPLPGRRFRGNVWLQGELVHLS